jgi:transcriptional regulator with XRE-family HTH domain
MANHRLREALVAAGLTPAKVASFLQVDPKTVERWVNQSRVPYPRHRFRLAVILGTTEAHLWPDVALHEEDYGEEPDDVAEAEVVHLYPHGASVPSEVWRRLVGRATERIDILALAGRFLVEQQPQIVRLLRERADAGVAIRLLLGDPDAATVVERDEDDGSGDAAAARLRSAQEHYRPLVGHRGIAVRLHETTLYNSIYQFDDEMLVSLHVYEVPAAHAPVLHLRRMSFGDLFEMYVRSFERIWQDAAHAWHLV